MSSESISLSDGSETAICDQYYVYEGRNLTFIVWMAEGLGVCAYTWPQIISVFIGLSSIACWLVAQAPQMWQNFKRKQSESLSFLFLFQWFLGDISNLVGCILTNQNATQLYTAIYFAAVDVLMLSQYIYYRRYQKKLAEKKRDLTLGPNFSSSEESIGSPARSYNSDLSGGSGLIQASPPWTNRDRPILTAVLFAFLLVGRFVPLLPLAEGPVLATGRHLARRDEQATLTSICDGPVCWTGFALGWVSAICYLGSRIPQLYKNARRRSTQGLSPLMFTMAVLGNSTYSLSIFLYGAGQSFSPYYWSRLPWIIGSAGTLLFDAAALVEFIIFRRRGATSPDDLTVSLIEKAERTATLSDKARQQEQRAYYSRIGLLTDDDDD